MAELMDRPIHWPRLKLQTFALAPGQCLIPKCSFCFKVLEVVEHDTVKTLQPCPDQKCIKAQAVVDAG